VVVVSPVVLVLGALVFALVVGIGLWALRLQRHQYPRGGKTRLTSGRSGAAGWFATKFTWLSGGRG
jgi:hypothetical protein